MKRILALALSLLCLSSLAQADVFNLGTGLTNLETVTVGDPGNAKDISSHCGNYDGQGSVSYTYNIGKYEVTAAQYCDFLNHKAKSNPYGLYNPWMWTDVTYGCKIQQSGSSGSYTYSVADDYANRPVNYVSYWDACRFTNWLSNGQGDGDTENGAYTLDNYNKNDGRTIQRNAGWKWAVTNEDEWYKAAYYRGGGIYSRYWDYPTGTNTAPGWDLADTTGNNANYHTDSNPYPIDSGKYYTTVVGEFQNSASPYGTFDQGGNLNEWNESITRSFTSAVYRCHRGGGFTGYVYNLQTTHRFEDYPTGEFSILGFRVVQAVPEPASILVLLAGVGGLIPLARRKK